MSANAFESLCQMGSELVQLPRVIVCQRAQQSLAPAREPQKHTAAVCRIFKAPQ